MSEVYIEGHSSPIKTWQQLLVAGVAAFVVPVLLIVAIVQLTTGGLKMDAGSGAMTEEAVANRLKPVGEALVGPVPPVAIAAPANAPSAAAAVPSAKPRPGDQVYQQVCAMCHAAALMGAPKLGDKAAWQPRVAQGVSTLYQHAVNGIRAMPARGGNASLSDADVKAAVDYMVGKAK
jgi:cytochrome c5